MAIDEAQDISLSHLRFFAALGQVERTHFSLPEIWASDLSTTFLVEIPRCGHPWSIPNPNEKKRNQRKGRFSSPL
jgi:hypothetical protein